ncbi:Ataxia telangiectasia and Rad3 related, partial [Caligus rogercresseyi]
STPTWKALMTLLQKHIASDDNEVFFYTLKGIARLCRGLEVEHEMCALSLLGEELLLQIGQILFENSASDPSMLNICADILLDLSLTCTEAFQSFFPPDTRHDLPSLEDIQGKLLRSQNKYDREEESKVKFIQLLAKLPSWLAPKWRLELLQKAIISNLDFILFNLSKDSHSFAEEIVSQTLRLGIESLSSSLVNVAPQVICALDNDLFVRLVDLDFLSEKPNKANRLSECFSFYNCKMIRPWSTHFTLTHETGRLWMNFFEKEECLSIYPRYIHHFSPFIELLKEQISRMMSNDEIVVDLLVALSKAKDIDHEYLIHELTHLYLSPKSHISTFIRARDFLRCNVVKYKYIILRVGGETLSSRTLSLLTVLFKSSKSTVFLNQNMHHILPVVVLRKSKKALELISTQAEVSLRHLLVENFQYVFPSIVFHSKGAKDYSTCISFVETITKVSLKELLPSKRQRVMTELLLSFSSYQKKILSALSWLAENDKE